MLSLYWLSVYKPDPGFGSSLVLGLSKMGELKSDTKMELEVCNSVPIALYLRSYQNVSLSRRGSL